MNLKGGKGTLRNELFNENFSLQDPVQCLFFLSMKLSKYVWFLARYLSIEE